MIEVLLSIIAALFTTVTLIIGYFGKKYITIIESNRDTLTELATILPQILKEISDQSRKIARHEKRIAATETRCKAKHPQRNER